MLSKLKYYHSLCFYQIFKKWWLQIKNPKYIVLNSLLKEKNGSSGSLHWTYLSFMPPLKHLPCKNYLYMLNYIKCCFGVLKKRL